MSIEMNQPINLSPTLVEVTWSGGGPDYYVYIDGIFAYQTTATTVRVQVAPGEVVQIEVLDDPDWPPMPAHPGRLLLTWDAVQGAAKYRIYEYHDGEWKKRAEPSETGRSNYQWQTRRLEDDALHQFRIYSVGQNGAEGVAREINVLMVRYPDVPDINLSLNEVTGKITIEEA